MSNGPADLVEVRLFAAARAAARSDTTSVEPGSLEAVCAELVARFPALADVLPRCSYLLNETAVHGEPSDVAVPAGSVVDVLPPFAGG